MATTRSNGIALHVEAAKRLLRELESQAETALDALGRDSGDEFLAAVNERDQILGQLDEVVEALAHERVGFGAANEDAETSQLLAEMARAAAAALESHEYLAAQTRRERDRVGAALERTARPDSIASQYGATSSGPRPRTFSVTG
jgi:hypothetical protein